MSAPEKKVEPLQASTIALTPESFSTSSSAASSPERTAAVMVLTGGASTVITATPSWRFTS